MSKSGTSFEMSTETCALMAASTSGDSSKSNNNININININTLPAYREYIGVTSSTAYGAGAPVDLGVFLCKKGMLAKIVYTIFITVLVAGFVVAIVIFAVAARKHRRPASPDNYTIALHQALLFFDAQKSGPLNLTTKRIEFRRDSGLKDGHFDKIQVDLTGGYYDSGNNIKFGFPTAYTITLISWSVIEYRDKYEAAGELDHVIDIIKWGTDYLLRTFDSAAPKIDIIYSQVGSATNDMRCWQRPEDMDYERPVSVCLAGSASDLAGEMAAALAAASIVFNRPNLTVTVPDSYSSQLLHAAQKLFEFAIANGNGKRYTSTACGAGAADFYNSSGYYDELVWGGSWVFFATGNWSYLQAVMEVYNHSVDSDHDHAVFNWNNKLLAAQLLLTRLMFLVDPGFPYENMLKSSTETIQITMCSYLSDSDYANVFNRTPGGLILVSGGHLLEYAATSAFLSKVYSDYLWMIGVEGWSCGAHYHRSQQLQHFSKSQMDYILGKNPMKMSYVVGYGSNYPRQVHHRAASIPSISIDKSRYGCTQGHKWLTAASPNPNILNGSMVAGPSFQDSFSDDRTNKNFTQPSIAANAGLVTALVALSMPMPTRSSYPNTMFSNIYPMSPPP